MNITNFDIQSWAKDVSTDFLQNKTPLNSGIEKVARDNNLNSHQVDRLVERTNGMTYVALANSSKNNDRYVEFPVANTREIVPSLDYQEPESDMLSDYHKPPEKTAAYADVDLLELFPGLEEEPEKTITEKEKRMIKKAAVEALERVNTTKREIAVVFDIESDKFIENIKQASLNTDVGFYSVMGHFNTLDEAVKSVLLPLVKVAGNTIPDSYKKKPKVLDEDYSFDELEKQGKELIKTIKAYKQLDEFSIDIVKTAALKRAGILGVISAKAFETTGKILQTASKSKKAMGALVGIPVVGATLLGSAAYVHGKETAEQRLSPMKNIPQKYNKWRA